MSFSCNRTQLEIPENRFAELLGKFRVSIHHQQVIGMSGSIPSLRLHKYHHLLKSSPVIASTLTAEIKSGKTSWGQIEQTFRILNSLEECCSFALSSSDKILECRLR